MNTQKQRFEVFRPASRHMVGDGFHVRNLFPSNDLGKRISPFLMLDYAGPTYYPPTDEPRGVDEHPHRGFETVTIVYQGNVEHRDSAGNHGTIGPGDVQWMTAASGVVHEEKHETDFAKRGGTLEMVQLWVNLPKALKMSPPGYQTLAGEQIPIVTLADDAGQVRVIAGEFNGAKGPARTFTPIDLWDVRLNAGGTAELVLPKGHTLAVFLLSGQVAVNGSEPLQEAELALFDRGDGVVQLAAREESKVLVMSGEPIDEPIASYGPFVMNTREEISQAVNDYRAGKMGRLERAGV